MGLTDESTGIPATMLVGPANIAGGQPYPVYYGGGQGGGNNNGGFGDGNGWWIILLIILLAAGNGFGNNNGGGGAFGGQPIIVNDGANGGAVQRGFDQAAIMSGITGVQSGVQNLSTQLCTCCGDIQMALCNGFSGVEMGANARQIANMQQAFAAQTAMAQGFNQLGTQFADCCCENRLGLANLGADIAREACATRATDTQNTQAILNVVNNGIQSIKDQLCNDKIDAKNEKIADLERQLTMANLSASQIEQTAQIQHGQVAEVDALYQRLRDCPVGTMPVYGNQPIFTCPQNQNSCGCGCGNF